MARNSRNDNLGVGFAVGFSLPLVIFFVIYLVRYPEIPVFDYLKSLWEFKVLIKILSLCVFPNLLVFLLYIRRKMDRAARGVLMATFVYAFVVLGSKIF